jgi:hypothetical protein
LPFLVLTSKSETGSLPKLHPIPPAEFPLQNLLRWFLLQIIRYISLFIKLAFVALVGTMCRFTGFGFHYLINRDLPQDVEVAFHHLFDDDFILCQQHNNNQQADNNYYFHNQIL